jgi:hypothetical protein
MEKRSNRFSVRVAAESGAHPWISGFSAGAELHETSNAKAKGRLSQPKQIERFEGGYDHARPDWK